MGKNASLRLYRHRFPQYWARIPNFGRTCRKIGRRAGGLEDRRGRRIATDREPSSSPLGVDWSGQRAILESAKTSPDVRAKARDRQKSPGMKTRDFNETVRARIQRDPAFRRALLREAIDCFRTGEVEIGKSLLRDLHSAGPARRVEH